MEIEDVQMQIQSDLCQLGVKDLEEIAKTLGCSDDDRKEKEKKGLVRLMEEKLEGTLKGTKAAKMEHLEEFKSQIMGHVPICPPLKAVGEKEKHGISQLPLGDGNGNKAGSGNRQGLQAGTTTTGQEVAHAHENSKSQRYGIRLGTK